MHCKYTFWSFSSRRGAVLHRVSVRFIHHALDFLALYTWNFNGTWYLKGFTYGLSYGSEICTIYTFPMPPHVLMNFRGFPPGCGDSVLRFGRPWGATTLSRWCEWWYAGRWNNRSGLKPKSTNYPNRGHRGNLSLQGKIPMVEPGIEPGTSWLVVRDPDHKTTRLVDLYNIWRYILYW